MQKWRGCVQDAVLQCTADKMPWKHGFLPCSRRKAGNSTDPDSISYPKPTHIQDCFVLFPGLASQKVKIVVQSKVGAPPHPDSKCKDATGLPLLRSTAASCAYHKCGSRELIALRISSSAPESTAMQLVRSVRCSHLMIQSLPTHHNSSQLISGRTFRSIFSCESSPIVSSNLAILRR